MSGVTSASTSSSSSGAAINIPFTFVGCSSPPLSAPTTTTTTNPSTDFSSSHSSLLSKGGSGLTVSCPPRSQRVRCLLRLSRPCRLTRVIVRNAGSVFLCVRAAAPSSRQLSELTEAGGELSAASVSALLSWSELVPEHQLCAAEVWQSSHSLPTSHPLPAPLLRVHTFPSARPMLGSFSPQLQHCTTAALCLEVRGAEDEWSREAKVGLSWLEVFGVPVQ